VSDIKILYLVSEYHPGAPDEIKLTEGDLFRIETKFQDGWVQGTNQTTGGNNFRETNYKLLEKK
jgi:hypothetical protein